MFGNNSIELSLYRVNYDETITLERGQEVLMTGRHKKGDVSIQVLDSFHRLPRELELSIISLAKSRAIKT